MFDVVMNVALDVVMVGVLAYLLSRWLTHGRVKGLLDDVVRQEINEWRRDACEHLDRRVEDLKRDLADRHQLLDQALLDSYLHAGYDAGWADSMTYLGYTPMAHNAALDELRKRLRKKVQAAIKKAEKEKMQGVGDD